MDEHLNKELLTRIAWLYYYEDRSQQEIGDLLGLPRIKVTRLLRTIRESRVVDIRIAPEYLSLFELEKRFVETTGLERAMIVPSGGDARANVAIAAAEAFKSMCSLHKSIGIGASRIVAEALDRIDGPVQGSKVEVLASLSGNAMPTFAANPTSKGWELSKALGVSFYSLWAPALAGSAAQAAALKDNPVIQPALKIANSVEAAIIGLGDIRTSLLHIHGFVSESEVEAIVKAGAVGEVFGHFYDAEGSPLGTGVEERMICVDFPMRCPVSAVAHGPGKVWPIVGAIRGGLIRRLITDELTAAAVIETGWGGRGAGR